MTRRRKPLTTAGLHRIIERWDNGGGVTAAVQAFAQAVPVAERTVWYWLGGRKIHWLWADKIRQIAAEKPTCQSRARRKRKKATKKENRP
jgi:hypothetical protein